RSPRSHLFPFTTLFRSTFPLKHTTCRVRVRNIRKVVRDRVIIYLHSRDGAGIGFTTATSSNSSTTILKRHDRTILRHRNKPLRTDRKSTRLNSSHVSIS